MKPGDMNFEALGPGLHTEGEHGVSALRARSAVQLLAVPEPHG